MGEWHVYIIRSLKTDFTYIGSTNNVQRRLAEHNEGIVQSTKAFRPFEVVAYVTVMSESRARSLERYFKTGSGKAVLRKRILTDEAPKGA